MNTKFGYLNDIANASMERWLFTFHKQVIKEEELYGDEIDSMSAWDKVHRKFIEFVKRG